MFIKGVIVSSAQLNATFDPSWFWTCSLVPIEQHLLEQHPTMPDFVLEQHWTTLDFMLLQQLKIDGLQLCSGPYQNRRYWKVNPMINKILMISFTYIHFFETYKNKRQDDEKNKDQCFYGNWSNFPRFLGTINWNIK